MILFLIITPELQTNVLFEASLPEYNGPAVSELNIFSS